MQVDELHNYYVEPVEIEVYLKKAGTVKTVVRDLYIELIGVEPELPMAKRIFEHYISLDQPIDLLDAQNLFPEIIMPVSVAYFRYMELYEKLSIHFIRGLGGSTDSWRQALYLTELLMKYEPTIASLEFLGDFHTHNLNYLVRKLNMLGEHFLLEDDTVAYLIRRKRKAHENVPADPEFDKLVELWSYHVQDRGWHIS